MTKEIELAQAKCTKLAFEAPVTLAKKEDDRDKGSDFIIKAYTGEAVNRWWGKLAIDIDGIKAPKNIPILRQHSTMNIVGFSTDVWKEGSFYVSGKFSQSTQAGQEVKALAEEGFPWQASIGVTPLKILSIEKDSSHVVNGKKLMGPAEVWLESEVYETSFVPLGADGKTSVSMLTRFEELAQPDSAPDSHQKTEQERTEEMITLEKIKAEHPDIANALINEGKALGLESGKVEGFKAGREEGSKAERDRIKAVRAQALAGHESLIEQMCEDGITTGEQAAMKILQAEKLLRVNAQQNLQADNKDLPKVPVDPPPPVDPSAGEDLSTPEGMKAKWDKDKALREEFGEDFQCFKAYKEAEKAGKFKVFGGKSQ